MVKAITIFLCLLCSNILANQTIDHSKEIDRIIANDLRNKRIELRLISSVKLSTTDTRRNIPAQPPKRENKEQNAANRLEVGQHKNTENNWQRTTPNTIHAHDLSGLSLESLSISA